MVNSPDLFPAARHVLAFDATTRFDVAVTPSTDPSLPGQGYELIVGAGKSYLRFADDAGRRYGEQAIGQLAAPDGTLPRVHLRDWPDLATRGFMLDVSRDRVPTRATLDRLVDVLSTCRYNQLQLYIEHTFAYRDHATVWEGASPITPEDLRWLDDRCRLAGIELVANQNCFGHMAPWLRHDRYRSRAECPDGFEAGPGLRLPPSTLEPTAANAEFVLALVREQLTTLQGRQVNIGCDETFELGRGASRGRVEQHGAAAIYAEHVHRIADPLVADGCGVQFWGDVAAHHPQSLDLLPREGTTALVWNYEAPDAPSLDLSDEWTQVLIGLGIDFNAGTHFARRVAPFAEAGTRFWVAPGTSSWSSLVGRIDNAVANLRDAVEAASASGAEGVLVTDWGDGGHHQPPAVSYPAIAYGGAVSWCLATNEDVDLRAAVNRRIVHDDADLIGGVLTDIGGVAERTGMVARNCSPLFAALFPHQFAATSGTPDLDALRDVIATLDSSLSELGRARPAIAEGSPVEDLSVAIELARFGAVTLAGRAGEALAHPARRHAHLSELIGRYRASWLTTSRPGGLERSVGHLERTRRRLEGEAQDA
ncbi:MAG: glycoside hydrolase [Acidimicrobiales bacterium]